MAIELNTGGDTTLGLALQGSSGFVETVAGFQADTYLTYGRFPEGSYIVVGGYTYIVAASAASDHHIENAGGTPLKLYALPINDAYFTPKQFGAPIDGINDDGDAIAACTAYAKSQAKSVRLGANEYRINARSTPLFEFVYSGSGSNGFAIMGESSELTVLDIQGDCTDFLFKVEGETAAFADPHASWIDFKDFSIAGNGNSVDLFSFTCADRCNLDNVTAFDVRGYGAYGREWWDSLANVRFVRCGDNLRIPFDAETQAFTRGQTITGGTSAATAWVMDIGTGVLEVTNVTGTFADNEPITGGVDGSATTNIPTGIVGSEKAVFDFDYFFASNIADSACNQIKFPETTQVEAYRWRGFNFGVGTRQVLLAGKVHWLIDRDYGGPAIYLDGPVACSFTPGSLVVHTPTERAVFVTGANFIAVKNRFIGVSMTNGITFDDDCRDNIVSLCEINNTGGVAAVSVNAGANNMIRNNMPTGDGPELDNTAGSFDFVLQPRRIYEQVQVGKDIPVAGWGTHRVTVYDPATDSPLMVRSGDTGAFVEFADQNTSAERRIGVQGLNVRLQKAGVNTATFDT